MSIKIGVLFFVISLIIGSEAATCPFLSNIREIDVQLEVTGRGQHRSMEVKTRVANFQRFTECRLGYEIEIPRGMFIDVDTVGDSLPKHFFHSPHRFNVEAPADKSKPHSVYVVTKRIFRKTFILEDQLSIPIHLRYHPATSGGLPAKISLSPAKVLIDCPEDYRIHKLEQCQGHLRVLEGLGVETKAPTWISLPPSIPSKAPIKVEMNTGDTRLIPLVSIGSTIAILISLAILIYPIANKCPEKRE